MKVNLVHYCYLEIIILPTTDASNVRPSFCKDTIARISGDGCPGCLYTNIKYEYNDDFIIFLNVHKNSDISNGSFDGLAFILSDSTYINGTVGGGQMGILGMTGAIVAEFDTFQNSDELLNSIALHNCIETSSLCDLTTFLGSYEIQIPNVRILYVIGSTHYQAVKLI